MGGGGGGGGTRGGGGGGGAGQNGKTGGWFGQKNPKPSCWSSVWGALLKKAAGDYGGDGGAVGTRQRRWGGSAFPKHEPRTRVGQWVQGSGGGGAARSRNASQGGGWGKKPETELLELGFGRAVEKSGGGQWGEGGGWRGE